MVTTAKKVRASHMVTDAVNGGVRTSCGMYLSEGKHHKAPDGVKPCNKCASHLAETPDRKRFVKDAYAARVTAGRVPTT